MVGQIYAAGFNAFNQLGGGPEDNAVSFRRIQGSEMTIERVLYTSWSTTALASAKCIRILGHQTLDQKLDRDVDVLHSAFGDHNGMRGCLDIAGRLYIVEQPESGQLEVKCRSNEDSPSFSYVAEAGNGRLVLAFRQTPTSELCHIAEFGGFESFLRWFAEPSGQYHQPRRHHMLRGRPKKLVSNTATFVLLMEDGHVYTWGDSRHQSLARSVSGVDTVSADEPGLVGALAGINIVNIAAGGWLSAALSEDGALYIWGANTPGQSRSITSLRQAGAGEVKLVNLPGNGLEPLDVLDVSIGDNHIAVITEDHNLYVVGENKNGQLALDDDSEFAEDWRCVDTVKNASAVVCGPKCTFIIVE